MGSYVNLNEIHLPDDAGDNAEDLKKIMERIPDGWGRWLTLSKGWYKLIIETDRKLAYICPDYEIHQVKEKFGTLRYYWGIPYDTTCFNGKSEEEKELIMSIMRDVVAQAEHRSGRICEQCGEFGRIREGGYFLTLCAACAKEKNYTISEFEEKNLS